MRAHKQIQHLASAETDFFSLKIEKWYGENKRNLPWRETKSAYRIWLSEIILQQTRVAQGLPYYQRFIEVFPSVNDLAEATEEQVLRLWQGLGYYSRGRNLLACARKIVREYHGEFPSSYSELQKLPGIGRYTAAAIVSFAFGKAVPAIDGNAFRVLSRVFGIKNDIAQGKSFRVFFDWAKKLMHPRDPALFNQALMEFGATWCTHKNPRCGDCPFLNECYAFRNKAQGHLPVKGKKTKVTDRYLHYIIFQAGEQRFLKKRSGKGIWQGLYEFYCVETSGRTSWNELEDPLLRHVMEEEGGVLGQESAELKHVLSHQRLFAVFCTVKLNGCSESLRRIFAENELEAFDEEQIHGLPKPVLIGNYFQNQLSEQEVFVEN